MPTRRRADSSRPSPTFRAEGTAHPARKKPTRRRVKNARGVTFRRRERIRGRSGGEAAVAGARLDVLTDAGATVVASPAGASAAGEPVPVAPAPASASAPVGAAMLAAAGIAGACGPESPQTAAAPDPSAGADADVPAPDERFLTPAAFRRALRRGLARADRTDRSLGERARDLLLGPARALAPARRGAGATAAEGFYVPAHQAHSPGASSLIASRGPGTGLNWAFALGLAGLLCLAAVMAFTWLAPARSADAQQYFAADLRPDMSTPQGGWTRGVVPALYQGDERWANAAYGVTTIGETGAAPCALCMAYVEQTGDTSRTPLDFAGWAEGARVASASYDDVVALLTDGAAAVGLAADPLEADALTVRHAIANGNPVICVTKPGTFDDHVSCVVLTGINEHSQIVLVDPSSAERTAESWTFDEVLDASDALYAYTVA